MSQQEIDQALAALKGGGVIAYPTEFCYGLGCDPRDHTAVTRILKIKQRQESQGLILVAASAAQVLEYADLENLARYSQITESWPGPTTWILPKLDNTPAWVCGDHQSIAMRVSAHPIVAQLCLAYSGAIVSTSANRHGQAALISSQQVISALGDEVDVVVGGELSHEHDQQTASQIFDALSGEQLR